MCMIVATAVTADADEKAGGSSAARGIVQGLMRRAQVVGTQMDNASLSEALRDSDRTQFWLKPTGLPDKPPDTHAVFDQARVPVEFAKRPRAMGIGDVVILYRIGVSKLICVARCLTEAEYVTERELQREPWRERWPWSVEARNLTPRYGSVWNQFQLQPFVLVAEYNRIHPEARQTLGSLQRGQDKLLINRQFAEFLIQRVIDLE